MNIEEFEKCKNDPEVNSRPFEYTLSLIGGKWKLNILFWLWKKDIMRYNELKRSLDGITHKMLSKQLKELETDHLIIRHEYPQVPPKVEYSLSKRGETLMPVLHEFCKWGTLHIDETDLD
ncbi:MAG: helix-turn-helix domain-containing protein [bacterium]|nr:helix-turn-helix domain-containing protein [bacterium]